MNVAEFIDKWRKVELTERSAAHQGFLNLRDPLGHPKRLGADPVRMSTAAVQAPG